MQAPHLIPEEIFKVRLISIMEVLIPKETADPQETRELFNLHNDRIFPRETGISCAGCRARVFNKMKQIYLQYIK